MLRSLRHKCDILTLWADAICINQENQNEKGQQVALMPRIYISAAIVYACLGGEADESDLAIETLSWIGTEALQDWPEHGLQPEPVCKGGELPMRQSKEWKAINTFLRRPWFSRIWIVQELLFAGRKGLTGTRYFERFTIVVRK